MEKDWVLTALLWVLGVLSTAAVVMFVALMFLLMRQ